MEPPVEGLLDKVDSKFTLVTLAAKRGREINAYFNQLGDGLGHIVPPQVTSVSRKPLSIALEEIYASKIVYRQRTPEDIEAEAAARADAFSAAENLAATPAPAVAEVAAEVPVAEVAEVAEITEPEPAVEVAETEAAPTDGDGDGGDEPVA